MTDNLLDIEATPPQEPQDFYQELVGEGKKFRDQQELAKGKWQSDHYIKTLEMQKDELRRDYLKLKEDYEARAKLEEFIDQLHKQPSQQPAISENTITAKVDKPGLDSQQIESLVSSKIQEHETSKKQNDNFNSVRNRLKERLGSNYQDVLKQQIDELGITEEYANNLARDNPTVFYRMFGLDTQVQQQNFQTPPRSTRISDNFNQKGSQKRTWSYYQDLKAKNPKIYYDPKIAVQMDKDMQELGTAFMDGDFKVYGDG
jgi:hypothetical protein